MGVNQILDHSFYYIIEVSFFLFIYFCFWIEKVTGFANGSIIQYSMTTGFTIESILKMVQQLIRLKE